MLQAPVGQEGCTRRTSSSVISWRPAEYTDSKQQDHSNTLPKGDLHVAVPASSLVIKQGFKHHWCTLLVWVVKCVGTIGHNLSYCLWFQANFGKSWCQQTLENLLLCHLKDKNHMEIKAHLKWIFGEDEHFTFKLDCFVKHIFNIIYLSKCFLGV